MPKSNLPLIACGTVEKALFSITCTTCQARLTVRDEQAIGAILECPKCSSFVQVTPPEGWQPGQTAVESPVAPVVAGTGLAGIPESPSAADSPTVEESPPIAEPPVEPPAPSPESIEPVAAEEAVAAETLGGPGGAWVSPAELLWRKWLLIGGVSAAGLVMAVGAWSMFFSSERPQPPVAPAVQRPAETDVEPRPATSSTPAEPEPSRFDRRWIPDATTAVFSLEASRLAAQPNSDKLIDQVGFAWNPSIRAVLRSLGLKPDAIERVTWAATDLTDWPGQSVVVLQLNVGHNADVLRVLGESAGLSFGGTECRQLPGASWPHPFAIVDQSTIVTGHARLLEHLDGRSEVHLENPMVDRLIETSAADADAMLLVDLSAARKAGWRLPGSLLDVWPAGKDAWHTVCDVPVGLGCTWNWTEGTRTELALLCDGPTPAEQVRAAVELLLSEADISLTARIEALPERLQAGALTATAAAQYKTLLMEFLAGSRAARLVAVDETVWVRIDFGGGPAMLAATMLQSRPAMTADWLAAARLADEANHRRLVTSLGGYQKAEGHYPAAAAGGALLPTETRLSWIAQMLPYYGHPDWHRQLRFGYDWNGSQNKPIARRPLSQVVNPALGPSTTEAGFPTTHYVGVTGVGPSAGRLPADDPRVGVFGFGRTARLADITDGASNTVAVLGVTKRLGAWAAGGDPTARGLTQRPYVNGPDGFGSGQPDGMMAGMADGSVRFLSKDIDPEVLQQLATIHGGRPVAIASVDPEPKQPPVDELPVDELPVDELPVDELPQRPPPIQVDAAAQLAGVLPELRLTDMPLADAVDLLASLSTAPISFDTDAMRRLGVTPRDPVSVDQRGRSFGQILETVAAGRGLVPLIEDGQVLLTGPADGRETLRQLRYAIGDLTGKDPADLAAFAELVRTLVAPDSWQAGGGRGTIAPDGGSLRISQTAEVHYRIVVFCEKLRVARTMPLRSRYDPKRFRLTTRTAEAADRLAAPMTANFHEPVPLGRIVAYIEDRTGIDLLLDLPTLYRAGISPDLPATLNVDQQPVAIALDELLGPLGLAYRVVDATTIEISTRPSIAARLELEFYPIGELLAKQQAATALLEKIKSLVAGATWDDAGGPGILHIDRKADCLIVLQSQTAQAEIERLLIELAQ